MNINYLAVIGHPKSLKTTLISYYGYQMISESDKTYSVYYVCSEDKF